MINDNNTILIISVMKKKDSPVSWGIRIHRLHLCNKCPGYETKLSYRVTSSGDLENECTSSLP